MKNIISLLMALFIFLTVQARASNNLATGKTDQFEIAFIGFEKAEKWTKTPKKGYSYYVLTYQVKNISGTALKHRKCPYASSFNHADLDGTRNTWQRSTGVPVDESALHLPGDIVQPDEVYEDYLIYAIPDSFNEVEVFYSKSSYGKPDLHFTLKK